MTDTTVDHDRVLTRRDMAEPGALARFHEKGQISGDINMGVSRGGARFENMLQVMEFAKLMAMSDVAVPGFLRGNPGACLRIAIQADEWGFSPFAVADKSYAVAQKGGDTRIAYESQLVHAIIERRAPLDGRLRMEYTGEGPTRRCRVIGRMLGEAEPFIWDGPEFQNIKTKNSPEWFANADKQLWYHASRDWARVFCPDVLMGVYTRDELEGTELGPSRARDTSDLATRLPSVGAGGYDSQGIRKTLASASGASSEEKEPKEPTKAEASQQAPQEQETTKDEVVVDKPAVETPPAAGEPTSGKEYLAFAEAWIEKATDIDNAEARWDGERDLRAKCKVSVSDRKSLEKKLNAKFTRE